MHNNGHSYELLEVGCNIYFAIRYASTLSAANSNLFSAPVSHVYQLQIWFSQRHPQ